MSNAFLPVDSCLPLSLKQLAVGVVSKQGESRAVLLPYPCVGIHYPTRERETRILISSVG